MGRLTVQRGRAMAMKKCPVCGVSVKAENLERHLRNQHPRAELDAKALLTDEERGAAAKAKPLPGPGLTSTGKWIISIAVVVIALLLAVVILNPGIVNPGSTGLQVGQVAPNFTASTTDGTTISLQALRGGPVLLEFMDPDCSHCQDEAPILASVYQAYGSRVHFLSIDANIIGASDSVAKINAFKSAYGTTWSYVLASPSLVQLYNIAATPTTFILNGNGVIVKIFSGTVVAATLTAALDQALQG